MTPGTTYVKGSRFRTVLGVVGDTVWFRGESNHKRWVSFKAFQRWLVGAKVLPSSAMAGGGAR